MGTKRKAFILLSFLLTLPLFTSCFYFEPIHLGKETTQTPVSEGEEYVEATYGSNYSKDNLNKDTIGLGMGYRYLPSVGESKILVIPIQTSDDKFTQKELKLIQDGFFGTEEETGWESVASYYEKSSYGKLSISGEVTAPMTLNLSTAQLEAKYDSYTTAEKIYTDVILDTVLKGVSGVDFSEYDTNGDGYLDAVWMVYSPTMRSSSQLYWAFTTWSMSRTAVNGYYPCCYAWASVDFFTEKDYSTLLDKTNIADSHTFIHETGHMMGLDDYYSYDYDYDPTTRKGNADTPVGGVDMMDFNIGDHTSYSKFYLGWESPTVINQEYLSANGNTLTLRSHTEYGESFLIPTSTYNGTSYDEYLLVEYYTPTNLNESDSQSRYTNNLACYSKPGVLLYHINATVGKIVPVTNTTVKWDGFVYNKLPPYSSDWGYKYLYTTLYSNTTSMSYHTISDSSTSFYRGRLISLLPATGSKIQGNKTGFATNSVLFQKEGSFSSSSTYSDFVFDDGTRPDFGFKVKSTSSDRCTIEFGVF